MPEFIAPTQRVEDFLFGIQTIGERAEHLKPVLQDIADEIMRRERRLFESRGATGGRYWTPLRASTVRRKTSAGATNPLSPLRLTDALMESLSVRGARYQILNVDDSGLEFGTRHPQADLHTSGTRKMPARPPLVVPKKHAHEYIGKLNDFIFGEGDYA